MKVAYHECGHAVMAWLCGVRVERVTIVANSWSLGHVACGPVLLSRTEHWDWQDWEAFMYKDILPKGTPTLSEVEWNREAKIMVSLAGGIAARRHDRRGHDNTSGDDANIRFVLRSYVTVSETRGKAYLDRLKARAAELLDEHWYLVKALADELLRKNTLEGDEVTKFLESIFQRHLKRKSPPSSGGN